MVSANPTNPDFVCANPAIFIAIQRKGRFFYLATITFSIILDKNSILKELQIIKS